MILTSDKYQDDQDACNDCLIICHENNDIIITIMNFCNLHDVHQDVEYYANMMFAMIMMFNIIQTSRQCLISCKYQHNVCNDHYDFEYQASTNMFAMIIMMFITIIIYCLQ